MTYNTLIPSVANTMKKIHLSTILLNEFTLIYYDDTYYCFANLFQQYTAFCFNNINHPYLIQYWKYNTDKAYYEDKLEQGVKTIL